jgi:hypothetical protein
MADYRPDEAAKRLDERVAQLSSQSEVRPSGCWNIGCFENKRFSVFVAAIDRGAQDGAGLTV